MQEEVSIFPEFEVVYGSFGERFAASLIDGLILAVPLLVTNYLFFGSFYLGISLFTYPGLITVFIRWLYSALQNSSAAQATIGKRAMNIMVTDMQGGRLSFGKATGRFFGKYVSIIILLIGYLMMLWDVRKQTLHDKMADTLVLSSSSGRPAF